MSAALLLAVFVAAAPFSVKFVGENQSSKPDPESNNAFETAAGGGFAPATTHAPDEPEGAKPPAAPKKKPAGKPKAERSKPAKAPKTAAAPAASVEAAEPEQKPQSSMAIAPPASAPSAPAADGAAAVESAAAGEQKRYDGGGEHAALQDPAGLVGPAAPPPTPDSFTGDPVPVANRRVSEPEGEVFVAIDLEHKPDRDAVADLGRAVGFRPDARFAPLKRGSGEAWVWGWMKPSRVAEAFRVPGVNRLQVEHSARVPAPSETTTRMAVQLRLGEGDAQSVAASVESDLKDAGVRFLALGEPGEGMVTVQAEAPVRALSRLLGHPRILSLGERPSAPAAPAVVEASAGPSSDFVDYAARKAPWLLLITLLLLLPPVARGAMRLVEVFVPYRR